MSHWILERGELHFNNRGWNKWFILGCWMRISMIKLRRLWNSLQKDDRPCYFQQPWRTRYYTVNYSRQWIWSEPKFLISSKDLHLILVASFSSYLLYIFRKGFLLRYFKMFGLFQVNELVVLSLNRPVKLFIDSSTDVAEKLRQEFVRIKKTREEDRAAIVVGEPTVL